MKYSTILLLAGASAVTLKKSMLMTSEAHACDYIDDKGEEISTSLMPEYVQIGSRIHKDDTVEEVQANMAQMNA